MNDSVTFFIALGIVFLVLRWLLGQGGNDQGQAAGARQARRLHVVRTEHVQTIQAMFPDIPEAAIRADLARTGSPAITSDNILRNGGTLPLPPATRAEQNANTVGNGSARNTNAGGERQNGDAPAGAASTGILLNTTQSPLVSRLRIPKDANIDEELLAPPKVWESDSEKRANILRKRKEFMLMEARKKYLEKQRSASLAKKDEEGSVAATKVTPARDEAAATSANVSSMSNVS
ncbi:hypothetical protein GGI26_002146 [Coemansia sp. RSA 1358]|uniref:CUE domain-containing protein n=1 Tax=Coemansia umbellata TaxID=1424467 RepID=A0ABQ8PTX7_9FUNG|nr:hypothetical protein BX070DRAFT_222627 [Coemansia spiralis]KAJ1995696.1 hypothetical protein EDC05_000630 [Coemansia umbellata]KAJ2623699.1 hypothetical protein GGI26_002146 [Coemansia sp. RSA 1358]